MDDPPDGHLVSLTVRHWQIIDATIDNEVSVEVVNGDRRGVVGASSRIREAGWQQVAHSTPGAMGGWPPDDQVVNVTLTAPEWALVVSCLEKWSVVDENRGDPQQAALSRAVRALVLTQLTDQGWAGEGIFPA